MLLIFQSSMTMTRKDRAGARRIEKETSPKDSNIDILIISIKGKKARRCHGNRRVPNKSRWWNDLFLPVEAQAAQCGCEVRSAHL